MSEMNPTAQHRAKVQTVGWGEPQSMTPVCTCGWTGQTVEEPYLTADELPDPPTGPAIRERCAERGHANPDRFGTYEEALIQALQHRSFDPDAELAAALAEFDTALADAVHAAEHFRAAAETPVARDQDYSFTERVDTATKALANIRYERHVWLTVAPPPPRGD